MKKFRTVAKWICIILIVGGIVVAGICWQNETLRIVFICASIFGAAAIVLGKNWLNRIDLDADQFTEAERQNAFITILAIIAICLLQLVIWVVFRNNYHFHPLMSAVVGAATGAVIWPPEHEGQTIDQQPPKQINNAGPNWTHQEAAAMEALSKMPPDCF